MKAAMLLLSSFIIVLASFTRKLPVSSAASAIPVTDVDGTPLRSGLKYFILPAVSGNGGGVALDRTKTKKCPLSVFQDEYELSKGLSVVFLPVNAKPGYTVQTATDLNIEFTAETACDEATVWKVESYDDDVKQWFIGTGGIEGKPGPRTVDNWFKIAKYGGNYKLVYCPSVCKSCKVQCKDVGVYEDEDGKKRLSLTTGDDPFVVKFIKAPNNA
ncbi:Kunitz trypsin inhibitor 5 [Linum grandiflorum]